MLPGPCWGPEVPAESAAYCRATADLSTIGPKERALLPPVPPPLAELPLAELLPPPTAFFTAPTAPLMVLPRSKAQAAGG